MINLHNLAGKRVRQLALNMCQSGLSQTKATPIA